MERIVQYLDDLEDLVYAVALIAERVRRAILRIVSACLALGMVAFGFLLALSEPPLALAAVSLVMVTALYRAAVGNARGNTQGSIPGT